MKWVVGILVTVAVLALLICSGVFFPIELVVYLATGWAIHIGTILPSVRVSWPDVALGLLALGLFAVGVHWFLRWLAFAMRFTGKYVADDVAWPVKYSAMIVALVMLMFVAGVATIGAMHHTLWLFTMEEPIFQQQGFGTAAKINHSLYKSRNLAIGLIDFESNQHAYPPGCTADAQGRLLHGWMTMLLPYIEEESLHQQIDRTQAWDSDANQPAFRTKVDTFRSARKHDFRDERGYAVAHYAANAYVIGGDEPTKRKQIRDGEAQTILLGEVEANCKAWGSPTNWRDPTLGLGTSPAGFGGDSYHGVTVIAFADGHAQAIDNGVDPEVLRAIATPAGGEKFDPQELKSW